MKFTKMQGAANDYIYINCFEETVKDPAALARYMSPRHFSVGADGIILICPSERCDVRMRMFNADGSEGEMCGNAIRCIGKYVHDRGIVPKTTVTVETLGGDKVLKLMIDPESGLCTGATVDMGVPKVFSELPEKITVLGEEREFVGIDVGNPHAVYFVDSKETLDALRLEEIGPSYENHPRFPNRVNSEFIYVSPDNGLYMRVWERGSGETWACGTGATSSLYAAWLLKKCGPEAVVHLTGGDLTIRFDEKDMHLYMTGPAVEVYRGEIDLPETY